MYARALVRVVSPSGEWWPGDAPAPGTWEAYRWRPPAGRLNAFAGSRAQFPELRPGALEREPTVTRYGVARSPWGGSRAESDNHRAGDYYLAEGEAWQRCPRIAGRLSARLPNGHRVGWGSARRWATGPGERLCARVSRW